MLYFDRKIIIIIITQGYLLAGSEMVPSAVLDHSNKYTKLQLTNKAIRRATSNRCDT